jgi:hypothetical protein
MRKGVEKAVILSRAIGSSGKYVKKIYMRAEPLQHVLQPFWWPSAAVPCQVTESNWCPGHYFE